MQNGGTSRGERLQTMLNGKELRLLDDFRFKKRMPSRAAAVRELLKRGLAAEGFEAAASGAKSEDFGVVVRLLKVAMLDRSTRFGRFQTVQGVE